MSVLRAGLVGLGQMGRHHARVLTTMSGVELVAVVDPVSQERSAAPLLGSVEELIANGIDVAVVAVPTALHEDVACQLAEASVHCLVEKPVAPDVAAALRMSEAFESRALVGAVGHIERFNPAVRELRRRLAAGELGALYQIVTRRQGPFPGRIADVGVVLDLATHDIDLTRWVTGADYVDVEARVAHRTGRRHEDLVSVVGTLSDGVVVNHQVNWLSPQKERIVSVLGERGAFVADLLTGDLTYQANGVAEVGWDTLAAFRGVVQGDVTRFAFERREPLVVELEGFMEAVRGRGADIVTLREGAETVETAERFLVSASEDRASTD